jgi:ribonuclease HI
VLVAPSKVKTCYAARLDFSCTNNIAEYEALLLGLRKLKAMGIRRAVLKTDSQVISGHIDKSCKARDPKLEKYLDTVRRIEASFEGFSVKNIPRGENEHADLLAKSAAQGLPLPSEVFFETIKAPSVELLERAVLNISPVYSEDWRTEIISYLQGNFLSDDEAYNKSVAEPPKLLGPHAPVLIPRTSNSYAYAPNNLTGSVRVSQGPRINHLPPRSQD